MRLITIHSRIGNTGSATCFIQISLSIDKYTRTHTGKIYLLKRSQGTGSNNNMDMVRRMLQRSVSSASRQYCAPLRAWGGYGGLSFSSCSSNPTAAPWQPACYTTTASHSKSAVAPVTVDSTSMGGAGTGNVQDQMLPSSVHNKNLFRYTKYPRTVSIIG
jgi:hypothetical protein